MTANGWFQIGLFFALILLIAHPLGVYMANVFERRKTFLDPVLGPIERAIYKLSGVEADKEMHWTAYAIAMLLFSAVSMLVLYGIERLQAWLPLNPQHWPGVPAALAFNTAASFTSNTNWQSYVPETTMSYLTQMAGLAYHNFTSQRALFLTANTTNKCNCKRDADGGGSKVMVCQPGHLRQIAHRRFRHVGLPVGI